MSIITENNDPHFIFVFRVNKFTESLKDSIFELFSLKSLITGDYGMVRVTCTQEHFTEAYNKHFLGKEDFYGVSHFGRFEIRNAYGYRIHVETFLPGKGIMSAKQKTKIRRKEAQTYLSKY